VDNVLCWNSSGSRVLQAQVAPRWRAVRQGLTLAALGHVLLLTVAVPGLVLAGLAPHAERCGWLPAGLGEEDAELIGLVVAGVAGALGYLLVVAGQWCCLAYAPQRDGAKEWVFVSLLCLLSVPVPFTAAHFTGGAANYVVLRRGLAAANELAWLEVAGLLQLAGGALVLLSCLLFTQFQRAARRCLAEGASSRLADGYCLFVYLLLGACAGPAVTSRPGARLAILEALAVGWGLSWLWHLAVILGTRRAIRATLRRLGMGTRKCGRLRLEPREPSLKGTGPAGP
jgi:hypothetical protein